MDQMTTRESSAGVSNDKLKLKLKLNEWHSLVSDATQCMRLSHEDEIKFLSSKNVNCESPDY